MYNVFSFSIEYGGKSANRARESEYSPSSISSTDLGGLIFIWDPIAEFLSEKKIKNLTIKKNW